MRMVSALVPRRETHTTTNAVMKNASTTRIATSISYGMPAYWIAELLIGAPTRYLGMRKTRTGTNRTTTMMKFTIVQSNLPRSLRAHAHAAPGSCQGGQDVRALERTASRAAHRAYSSERVARSLRAGFVL